MMDYLKRIQTGIILALTWMMSLVVILATMELAYILVRNIITYPYFVLQIDELLEIFGYFLLILIGIELLETFKIYVVEKAINVQVVFLVAMIAIARKVIILDVKALSGISLIGIGVVIMALSVGYYLVKKSQTEESCTRL